MSAQLNERNATLQEENTLIQQQIASINQQVNMDLNPMDIDKADGSHLMKLIRDEIRNEMSTVTQDIEARIRVEHEKMTTEIAKLSATNITQHHFTSTS